MRCRMLFTNLKMNFLGLWCLLFVLNIGEIHGTTHWMVTEDGLIQPRVDSPFEMARPYDLLAFLNQDTRWDNIINLYHDLVTRQHSIKHLWTELEREAEVTSLLNRDDNCVKTGSPKLIDWYSSFLEYGTNKISTDEISLPNINFDDTNVPDCKKISSLIFSLFVFEHLESMRRRDNLSADPELSSTELQSPTKMSVDQFGDWLAGVLKQNSSSWIHYNMASLYWRVKGIVPKALECSRRAVHYAPRAYKDIALLGMGLILHRSKMSEDAVIVLGAAVDHGPQCPVNHFVLANTLAVIGDFDSSVVHYDACLKLNPNFALAQKHKDGVLCHRFLLKEIQSLHGTLTKLREELKEYTQREIIWLKSQSAFLRTMKHTEEFDFMDVEKSAEKMTELTGLNIKDLKTEGDKYALIGYFLEGSTYGEDLHIEKGVHAINSLYNLQTLVKHVGRHVNLASEIDVQGDSRHLKFTDGKILKEIGPTPMFNDLIPDGIKVNPFVELHETKSEPAPKAKKTPPTADEVNMSEYDTGIVIYPPSIKISRTTEDFDIDPDWPPNKICLVIASTVPANLDAVYQIFLPFENKGIRMSGLLSHKLGVPVTTEYELPWHPPTCPTDKDAAAFTQKKSQKPQIVTEVIRTEHLRRLLSEYVSDGDIDSIAHMQYAEIGHRIYAAMQMKLAPKWLLYTLASLYWRVRENNFNALHCIMTASRTAEPKFKDIILVSMSSLYIEMGYFDEALAAAEEAFKLSLYEPSTNFLLAELNMIKQYRYTHMFHLKQVIRVEPNFMNGLARTILSGWACLLKHVNVLQELEIGENDICTQVEPGMSMVCEKDGGNCHLTNIQCFNSQARETSALSRMIELKGNHILNVDVDDVGEDVFDHLVPNKDIDRTDKRTHYIHFEAMRKSVDNELKGCGTKGCANIEPEDLALKEEDCIYQHLELGNWLYVISFKEILSEASSRLPLDILSITPSSKNIPDCRIDNASEDFYMDRFIKVNTAEWEPVLNLMHQFAETFNFFDYVALGAKLARYVDMHPDSWAGLALAGWWCGASGRGACAARCLAAAHARAPLAQAPLPTRALAALLHVQSKHNDAKEVAYLSFYVQPKSKFEAVLLGISHTYLEEYEPAVWMYRYALTFDDKYLPAKACLHATMCIMLFGETAKAKPNKSYVTMSSPSSSTS